MPLHFYKNVSVYQSFFPICLSFSPHIIRRVLVIKKSEAVLNNWNLSARLSNVSLFSGIASPMSSSSSSGPGLEASSPSSHLLLIPLVKCIKALEFLKDHISQKSFTLYLSCCIHNNLFYDFLGWHSCKSCEVMHNIWMQFYRRNLLFQA